MLSNRMRSIIGVLLVVTAFTGCGKGNSDSNGLANNGAKLVSISITPADSQIAVNTSQRLSAIGIYSDNSKKDLTGYVTWSSSDAAVTTFSAGATTSAKATMSKLSQSSSGAYVYGNSAGQAIILATLGDISSSAQITVSDATLVSIAVTPTNPSIGNGTNVQLTATGTFSDDTTQDLTASATWSSSNTGVTTVSNDAGTNGLATSVSAGSTTITAALGSIMGSASLTVTPATLSSITVTPFNSTNAVGTTRQFTATGTFSDGTKQDMTSSVTWAVSYNSSPTNATVTTISNAAGSNGLASFLTAGGSTIIATLGNVGGYAVVTVTPVRLLSISITPSNPINAQKTNRQFVATGLYNDGSTQDMTASVTWLSSNATVAAISNAAGSDGLASCMATGTSTVMAVLGNVYSAPTSLTVTPATLSSITITPSNPTNAKGTTRQFTAIGTFSDGTTKNLTASVTWSSSNTASAAISNAAGSNGLTSCLAAGTSTITATSGSVTSSTSLTVTSATLSSISIIPSNPTNAVGTTRQFTATGRYSDGTTQDLTASVTWSSSNTASAAISNAAGSNGLASCLAAGTSTITATSGSITGSTSLTVTLATLSSISITPSNPTNAVGTTRQFAATGTYSDGTTQDVTASVTWSTSTPGVATISNAAGSKGLAAAIAAGTTTITAVSGSVSKSTTLTVTAVTVMGSATLAWIAPTTYTDGTTLTSLWGYKIYYGTSPGNYTISVNVGNVTTYTVTNLSTGTYYFAVTAYDISGIESSYSNQVSKTF